MDASSAFKDSLPTSPETLLDKLTSLDISFTTHTHPPLRTVEDAKAFRGDLPGAHILKTCICGIVKNVIFCWWRRKTGKLT
jgi:hypothetical protein